MIKSLDKALTFLIDVIQSAGYAWKNNPLANAWRVMRKERQIRRHITAQHLEEQRKRRREHMRQKASKMVSRETYRKKRGSVMRPWDAENLWLEHVREKQRIDSEKASRILAKARQLDALKKEQDIRQRERIRAEEQARVKSSLTGGPQYPPRKHNKRMSVMVCKNCGLCGPVKVIKEMISKRGACIKCLKPKLKMKVGKYKNGRWIIE